MTYKKIDRKSPAIMSALAAAPLFKKQGTVRARAAKDGEVIETILGSGDFETENVAVLGDWIVTNPTGEQYIISGSKFFDRYEDTDENGVFAARGYCRAIPNPEGVPIEIMASWGTPQMGDENCLVADTCDENGENMGGEPYLIEGDAFAVTYAPV